MFEKVARELQADGKFCYWKYEERGRKKPDKVPYRLNGALGDPSDIRAFSDFGDIVRGFSNRYSGIGMGVFGRFAAVDIDDCLHDGVLSDLAEDVVNIMDTYTEISPSGHGVRLIGFVDNFDYDKNRYYINNREIGLEIYVPGCTKRFLTITGDVLRYLPVRECAGELKAVLEKYMVRPVRAKKKRATAPGSYLSDESVLAKAAAAKNGEVFQALWNGETPDGKSPSEGDMSLAVRLAFWCGGDKEQMDRLFRESGRMRSKWDRIQSGSTYGEITLDKAIAMADTFYAPVSVSSPEDDFDPVYEKLAQLQPHSNSRYQHQDLGFGRLYADVFKDVARYVPERKCWFVYDGRRWQPDIGTLKTMELCKGLADAMLRYALTIRDEGERTSFLSKCQKWQYRKNRTTYLNEAQSVYPISMSVFDRDIYLLNCGNVTVDVRTGSAHEHTPEDMITRLAGADYDPSADAGKFKQFVSEILEQPEKVRFMQKAAGYTLTGDTSRECLFIAYGPLSRNGKGTFMESILGVMGEYGLAVRPETIAQKNCVSSQGPSEDVARLAGIRFANLSEPSKGMVLNAAQVKSMTGNDTLNARFLHENSFDFKPQFKIFINTNYLPVINDQTLFSSGRVMVIPFDRHFEESEQDRGLKAEFSKPEARSAILNWMLEGFQMYLREGLDPPECVRAAIAAYAHTSDKFQLFVDDCLETNPSDEVKTSEVYDEYRRWCSDNGYYPESKRNLNQSLRTIGPVERKRPQSGGEKTTLLVGYKLVPYDFL